MKTSKHAQKRMGNRSINKLLVDLLCFLGTPVNLSGGLQRIQISKKEIEMIITKLSKDPYLVLDPATEKIITVSYQDKRWKK